MTYWQLRESPAAAFGENSAGTEAMPFSDCLTISHARTAADDLLALATLKSSAHLFGS